MGTLCSVTLLVALRAAARGQAVLDPAIADVILQELSGPKKRVGTLSECEQTVLRQIALAYTNRQITERLIVSEETIKTHVGNILARLHLNHRMQATIYALKQGLISLDEITTEGVGNEAESRAMTPAFYCLLHEFDKGCSHGGGVNQHMEMSCLNYSARPPTWRSAHAPESGDNPL